MRNLAHSLVPALTAAALSTACSQGVAGGSSGPGQEPYVQFSAAGFTRVEATEPIVWKVELDVAYGEDVQIEFTWSGDMMYSADYTVPSAGLVTIPAGDINTTIFVEVYEDELGELDEVLQLQLKQPLNAKLGSRTVSQLTVVDDDAIALEESEPNDDPANSDVLGSIAEGVAYEVTGQAVLPSFDWFEVTGNGPTTLYARLDPQGPFSQVRLDLADGEGNPIDSVVGSLPGQPAKLEYELSTGETVRLGVSLKNDETTAYLLDVVGL